MDGMFVEVILQIAQNGLASRAGSSDPLLQPWTMENLKEMALPQRAGRPAVFLIQENPRPFGSDDQNRKGLLCEL